jgi:hypothetical protein
VSENERLPKLRENSILIKVKEEAKGIIEKKIRRSYTGIKYIKSVIYTAARIMPINESAYIRETKIKAELKSK